MNSVPLFTVVIPSYNRERFISTAIDSVLSQTFRHFELLIINDGSDDQTVDVVNRFKDDRIRYFEILNSERGAARNYGIKHAYGQYVTFLDSDDFFKKDHLSTAAKFIDTNRNIKIFSLGYDIITVDGRVIYPWKPLPDPANEKLMEGNFLSCMGVFVERKVVIDNPFNENRGLAGSEDYELWLRLAARYPIHTVPISTACLVSHADRSVVKIDRKKLLLRRMLLKKYTWSDPEVVKRFSRFRRKLDGYMDLYVALHLAIGGFKCLGIAKLWGAFQQYPIMILNRRFWAVIKKIVGG